MSRVTYILACEEERMFTSLNHFDSRRQTFAGEYSLLHNAYAYDDHFLAKFLMAHEGHALVVLNSRMDRYHEVLKSYSHFSEEDIALYMEERTQRQVDAERELDVSRHVGQLQLLIARQMIDQEREATTHVHAATPRDTYVLLGKEWALRWSVDTIDRLAEHAM
jgi:hypothetical protein